MMARITRMTKRRLGELLQAEGLLTETQLRAGLDEQRKSNLLLGEALVKLGFVSEEAIAHVIVQQFSLPFMSALQCSIAPEVLNIFPERMYHEYQFIAVDKIGPVLLIIGAGLMNHDVLDELERLSGCRVCQYVSTWGNIRNALAKYAPELKKGQSNLSGLGEMLLDSKISPLPQPRPSAPAAPTVAQSPPAVPQQAEKPMPPAKPVILPTPPPAPAAAPSPPAVPSQAEKPVSPAKPVYVPAPPPLPAAAVASTVRSGSPGTAAARPSPPSRLVFSGAAPSRLSALSGTRLASSKSSQNLPSVPPVPATPPTEAAPLAETKPLAEAKLPALPKHGLLGGLFKKS